MSRFLTFRSRFAIIAVLGLMGAGLVAMGSHTSVPTVVNACLACNNQLGVINIDEAAPATNV